MATEIADSDSESELDCPARPEQLLLKHLPETQERAASNDLGLHFSDFLSQKQQLDEEWCLRSSNSQQTENLTQLGSREAVAGVDEDPMQRNHLLEDALIEAHVETVRSESVTSETTPTSRKRRHTTLGDGAAGS